MHALRSLSLALPAALLLAQGAGAAPADLAWARLKDVARLEGPRALPLVGYGLVAGLNRTGDRRQTIFSAQTLANMLQRLGVVVPGEQIKVENVAAVLVTAELSPYARGGGRFDVLVSSVGDARSLQGGTLLATALRGPDGAVYALAQGPLSIGGFGGGQAGNSVQVNHLTAGRVPGGGLVQASLPAQPSGAETLRLSLVQPDFTTATKVAEAINADLGRDTARAADAGTVSVKVPELYRASVPDLMARLEAIDVEVDVPARVVISERTGTVVVGSNVRIGPAAVAHGNLSVKISTRYEVSQPAPFAKGETTVTPEQRVDVREGRQPLMTLEEGTSLDTVVKALNGLGATPRDIIAILQALQVAGALRAEIVIL
ncbi:MAG: flagellar basal body P-ring protein FlgI [Acidobacteria bacterium]|nr:MAG: flagellar basal body P-ring protein FlgI [Acidobacteriota bacterium]RPJ77019.1 MAG: flagellar basal body P-ring protein FlgI [Acidobacteriota bacterium]